MQDFLSHEGRSKRDGAPIGSGRYPLGSGDAAYQHAKDFGAEVKALRAKGLTDTEIARYKGMTTGEFRARVAISTDRVKKYDISQAFVLRDKGYSKTTIGKKLGVSEGTIRQWLNPNVGTKRGAVMSLADTLKDEVKDKKYVDVGSGTERLLGVSQDNLKKAVKVLELEGYSYHTIKTEQVGTGHMTNVSVLASPGTTLKDVSSNRQLIQPAGIYSEDNETNYRKVEPPRSVSSSRVKIRYAEDGGIDKDGVIELRRGVDDVSLHNAKYAQVRIAVDDSHYIKGMAVYGDDKDFPSGTDIIFNTNKHKGTPMIGPKDNSVLKPFAKNKETGEVDTENPFKASIKLDDQLILAQRHYIDKNGKEQLSCLNIVSEEGDWGKWSKNLASQFLSKQPLSLAKRQLNLALTSKKDEYEEISSLTNPEVKKKLLADFADNCDSAAVHLKAASMPRQQTHVILPVPDMNENQCYAPNYNNGERLALVRYPHGGTFEIPVVTVNNNNAKAKKIMGNAPDAMGINPKVAGQLSGADFDGDTVVAIPMRGQNVKTSKAIKALQEFDPKSSYPKYDGMKVMTEKQKGKEMGIATNLITDMTLKGADIDEIVRATKYSMVVIDSAKHELNWKKAYKDFKIGDLKNIYQTDPDKPGKHGASTLISRAKSEERVLDRTPLYSGEGISGGIYVDTGEKAYRNTGKTVWDKSKQEYVPKLIKSTKMAETSDARTLLSAHGGTNMEQIYADYANSLKALANKARKEYVTTPSIKQNKEAKKKYAAEVESLKNKLDNALKNAPLERHAQLLANYNIKLRFQNNPNLDKDDKKKIKGQELTLARNRVGAKKDLVDVSDREWEAIQSGAVSSNMLSSILKNTDVDKLKERATPRITSTIPPAKYARAIAMLKSGFISADVAKQLGISVSTLKRSLESHGTSVSSIKRN